MLALYVNPKITLICLVREGLSFWILCLSEESAGPGSTPLRWSSLDLPLANPDEMLWRNYKRQLWEQIRFILKVNIFLLCALFLGGWGGLCKNKRHLRPHKGVLLNRESNHTNSAERADAFRKQFCIWREMRWLSCVSWEWWITSSACNRSNAKTTLLCNAFCSAGPRKVTT